MKPKLSPDAVDYFHKAVLTLRDEKEVADFFRALCTPLEISTMSQRLLVANLLHQGEVYLDIVAETTASTATISRVKRSMEADPGVYSRLFEKLPNV